MRMWMLRGEEKSSTIAGISTSSCLSLQNGEL
jgi:hypothetical protein